MSTEEGKDPTLEVKQELGTSDVPLKDAAGLPVRTDITLQWNPPFGPGVGDRVKRGDQHYTVTNVIKVGDYIWPPYLDRNGRVRTQQYPHCIMQTRYNEGRKHSEDEALCKGTARVRPARRRFLNKLARYQARVK